VNYTGWKDTEGHKHDRPYEPADTAAFNRAVWEREQKKAAAKKKAKS
jgi:hypothetical protein